MVVWSDPDSHAAPYIDDVETDASALAAELDAGVFVLRAISYRLEWLGGPERAKIARDFFDFPESGAR